LIFGRLPGIFPRLLTWILPVIIAFPSCASLRDPTSFRGTGPDFLLEAYVTGREPWTHIEANSEQRQPVYFGKTPREIALGFSPSAPGAEIPDFLRDSGEAYIKALFGALRTRGLLKANEDISVEMWPARNDDGILVWALTRWRGSKSGSWRWLDTDSLFSLGMDPRPFLPAMLRRDRPEENAKIFDDFLKFGDLYEKPVFGDCVWTEDSGDSAPVMEGWLTLERMNQEKEFFRTRNKVCRLIPQPSRVDGKPSSYVVRYRGGTVQWPTGIAWKSGMGQFRKSLRTSVNRISWPGDFLEKYRTDVQVLAGEKEARFPISGRTARFARKNSADPGNQLLEVVEYLEERYRQLGMKTIRQEFIWRGIDQSNLIAVIPGSEPRATNRPVVMGDHIDTAYCEDEFTRTGNRISSPGADDNASATAALLRAAEILVGSRPRQDIWLVHFTGEEFPADDLGARYFIAGLLKERQDLGGVILMDLIGHRKGGDMIFQINAGESEASFDLAVTTMEIARAYAWPRFQPVLRTRNDERSYLYNTDGLIFSEIGYPVVLLNEHMNARENLEREGYHDTKDRSEILDWEYATVITKVAIATAARVAESRFP